MTRSTRDSETRKHEIRERYNMEYVSPLDVPDEVRKEGYSYAFVRKEVKGQDDYRLEAMSAKGWTPVPADRIASRNLDPLNRNPLAKQFICYKDVILMERPEIYSIKEQEHLNQKNTSKIRSLKGVSNDGGVFTKHSFNQ